jgi:DNA replication protein DnaC
VWAGLAARLDNTLEAEMRRLVGVELLILDDLALQAMDPTETELTDGARH